MNEPPEPLKACPLSKRELFAMAAMQGLIEVNPNAYIGDVVRDAFEYADAMLAESAKRKDVT